VPVNVIQNLWASGFVKRFANSNATYLPAITHAKKSPIGAPNFELKNRLDG